MFDESITHSDRRGFLTRTAAGAAMAALATLPTWVEAKAQAPAQGDGIDHNTAWLRGLTPIKHKQFFETGTMNNAIPFLHIVNYFGAWRAWPGVRTNDVSAVMGIFGMAVPTVFGDAMWSKYGLGKMMNLTDAATGQPYTRNPYLNPQNGELFTGPSSMVAAVQGLGARVILCNNAFGFWNMLIGKATNQDPAAVRTEMLGNLAPGVTIIPAMVQAVEQAQRAGLTYMKNS
ncbi:MAG TPA: twin-arginine translocation signal domain-containing protein [Gemmatimonadales bacterium]|nr:twin-arginine translocation signal domain-containing protein [Gemmatimonadales bacterium]